MTTDHLPIAEFLSPSLPAALDGSNGINRARNGVRHIAADTDVEAIRFWLAEYAHFPHTLPGQTDIEPDARRLAGLRGISAQSAGGLE